MPIQDPMPVDWTRYVRTMTTDRMHAIYRAFGEAVEQAGQLHQQPQDQPMTTEPVPCDPVAHPKHYTSHPSGIECIAITRHMGFNLGNAVKYIWRADLKGHAVEDLRKAAWYIADEIAKRDQERP